MEKKYFFRDLDHNANFSECRSYHAAGIVVALHSEIGKPSYSGKDAAIRALEPFTGRVEYAWRSFDEIELFEADEYNYADAKAALDAVDKLKE